MGIGNFIEEKNYTCKSNLYVEILNVCLISSIYFLLSAIYYFVLFMATACSSKSIYEEVLNDRLRKALHLNTFIVN